MVTQVAVTGREKEPDQVEAGPPSTLPTGCSRPTQPGGGVEAPLPPLCSGDPLPAQWSTFLTIYAQSTTKIILFLELNSCLRT